MSRIVAEVVLIFILILANGIFAMSEIALVSVRRARLQRRADAGDAGAAAALALASNPNNFLSTVQVGITLIGILAGAFGGATLAEQIGEQVDRLPLVAPHGETVGVFVVVAAITYFSVVLGELVPKRIALSNPEAVARLVARPMRRLSRWARPIVTFLTASADAVGRILPVSRSKGPSVTDEELTALLALGTKSGAFHPAEQEMVRGVLALGDRRARMVMTRRQEVAWLDVRQPIETLQRTIAKYDFSRFPVGDGSLDELVGVLEVRDVVRACFDQKTLDVRSLARPAIVFPENTPAVEILKEFHRLDREFAVVVDEYGGIAGIVTMEDLANTVLGRKAPSVIGAAGSWVADGMIKFDEFLARFPLPDVDPQDYDTLAGFVIARLGHFPTVGERVTHGAYRFQIADMDGKRIHRIAISYADARAS